MSIFGAMYSGVSGLLAQSEALSAISDNISNSNTVGYKGTTVNFATLVTVPETSNSYTSGGVMAMPQQMVNQQGTLQAASSPTDLGINGSGFFVVTQNPTAAAASGNSVLFTRAGDFQPDASGNLVNSAGFYLQGFPTNAQGVPLTSNTSSTTGLQPINVTGLSGTASATQNLTVSANLPATAASGTVQDVTAGIYDSLGVAQNLTLQFTKTTTANQWSVTATSLTNAQTGASSGTVAFGPTTVTFNTDGTLASVGATSIALTGLTDGAANQTIAFNPGTAGQSNGLSQFAGNFALNSVTQDGQAYGTLTGVTINNSGLVTATFSNGSTRPFAQIPLATFPDVNGLTAETGNVYQPSGTSGAFALQTPGVGAAGQIKSGTLEQSTVDLATEFTNLIVAQQAYSASSRVVTTANQMLQVLDQIGVQV